MSVQVTGLDGIRRGDRVILTLWEKGSLVGVSSHESDETVENTVIVNPTSSASPSYEAIRDSEPSWISSVETRAWRYDENPVRGTAGYIRHSHDDLPTRVSSW